MPTRTKEVIDSEKTIEQVTVLKMNLKASEVSIKRMIHQMERTMANIQEAGERQKNVSTIIKEGLSEIKAALQTLNEERESQKRLQDDLTGLLWSCTREKNLFASTPKTTSEKKRSASSPAASPIDKKKKKDLSK